MKIFLTENIINTFINVKKNNSRWIFDKNKLLNQIYNWKLKLPWIKPYYALKSNPSEEIIKTLYNSNIGFDAASMNEILLAKKYSDDIIYTNPHTNLQDDISNLNYMRFKVVDDIGEIDNLKNIKVDILIRLNSCIETANTKFDSKFGCTKEEAYDIIEYANLNNLKVRGISFHIGSGGIHNRKNAYLTAYNHSESLLYYLKKKHKKTPILDIGGGLLYNTDLTETLGWTEYIPYEIIAEPGRYFSEPSYHLFTQIIAKTKRGLFLDNGVYHELNIYHRDNWNFPLLTHYYDTELHVFKKIDNYQDLKIFGPTCDSYDTLNICKFPKYFKKGDFIFLGNMGSYSSAGSCNFNGINSASYISDL